MLRNFHKLATTAAIAAGLVFAPAMSAKAYTVDPQVFAGTKSLPARECANAVHALCYLRVTFNFNDASIAAGVPIGTIPKNAYIYAIDLYVTTAFNAVTTNVMTIGSTKAGVDIVAVAQSPTLATPGIYHVTTAAGLGLAVTGSTGAQTAINGGIPVWLQYSQTGTAATTGKATLLISIIQDNDN